MVKKTYLKSIRKTLTGNISRFLVMCLVIMLGICFVSGLGTLSSSLTHSIKEYYEELEGLDLIIKTKNETGFTMEEITSIEQNPYVDKIKKITSIDKENTRLIIGDLKDDSFHKLSIVEGRFIENNNEILVDRTSKVKLNELVELNGEKYKVVGIVNNPSYYVTEKEISIYGEELDYIYYLDSSFYDNMIKYVTSDIHVKLDKNKISNNIFSKDYEKDIKKISESLEKINDNFIVLSLEENLSFALTKSYGQKIEILSSIFPLFFILVSSLVVYSCNSRLISDERPIIGCYRSLGINKMKIVFKYLSLSFITCLIGSIIGFFLGIYLIPKVVYPALEAMFLMPQMTSHKDILPGILTSVILISILSLITLIEVLKELSYKPCELLKHKSPIKGKKILLERFSFIWKRLKFKYKSSLRNVFRYKVNLILTIISVSSSTALCFAGFGLYSVATNPKTTEIPLSMADSFALISSVIIIFAALLCILVVFNITNMNIQERKREIATLRVLGYQKEEVSFYIYREINFITFIGLILGLPLGYIFLNYMFKLLEFGNIKNVYWYYYLITVLIVIIFIFLAEILLTKKIHKIDMNGSLKSNE